MKTNSFGFANQCVFLGGFCCFQPRLGVVGLLHQLHHRRFKALDLKWWGVHTTGRQSKGQQSLAGSGRSSQMLWTVCNRFYENKCLQYRMMFTLYVVILVTYGIDVLSRKWSCNWGNPDCTRFQFFPVGHFTGKVLMWKRGSLFFKHSCPDWGVLILPIWKTRLSAWLRKIWLKNVKDTCDMRYVRNHKPSLKTSHPWSLTFIKTNNTRIYTQNHSKSGMGSNLLKNYHSC